MDDHRVPPYLFGGSTGYWSAVRGPDDDAMQDELPPAPDAGSELRVMWDWGGGPLWSPDGDLPGNPEWLGSVLGLSERLAADLLAWAQDMNRCQRDDTEDAGPLHARGKLLARRLQDEVGTRYRVRYVG